MNTYSDILDRLDGTRPIVGDIKIAKFNWPLKDYHIGDSCTFTITAKINAMSTNSTDLEIINITESQGSSREDELMKMKVFPSPS